MDEADGSRRRGYRQRQHDADAVDHVFEVLLLDRVEEELVPAVDAEGRREVGEGEGEHAEGQDPGLPLGRPAPEAPRHAEERPRDIARRRPRTLGRMDGGSGTGHIGHQELRKGRQTGRRSRLAARGRAYNLRYRAHPGGYTLTSPWHKL